MVHKIRISQPRTVEGWKKYYLNDQDYLFPTLKSRREEINLIKRQLKEEYPLKGKDAEKWHKDIWKRGIIQIKGAEASIEELKK